MTTPAPRRRSAIRPAAAPGPVGVMMLIDIHLSPHEIETLSPAEQLVLLNERVNPVDGGGGNAGGTDTAVEPEVRGAGWQHEPRPAPVDLTNDPNAWQTTACACHESGQATHALNCPVSPGEPIETGESAPDPEPADLVPTTLGLRLIELHDKLAELSAEAELIVAERDAVDARGRAVWDHARLINDELMSLAMPYAISDLLFKAGINRGPDAL